jgi:hypothetical protein
MDSEELKKADEQWPTINKRRFELIKRHDSLTESERHELDGLQKYAERYLDAKHPLDHSKLDELLQKAAAASEQRYKDESERLKGLIRKVITGNWCVTELQEAIGEL